MQQVNYYSEFGNSSYIVVQRKVTSNRGGFTIVELIITVVILAIITVMAVPSFVNMYTRKKLESSAHELTMRIAEARVQAVTLRDSTGICLSSLSNSDCATALSIIDTYKNRIFIAQLDKGVTATGSSATSLRFRNNGSIASSANFILVRNNLSYCVSVGITGDTTVKEGACT